MCSYWALWGMCGLGGVGNVIYVCVLGVCVLAFVFVFL